MESVSVFELDTTNTNYEVFLYSIGLNTKITFIDSTVQCRNEYYDLKLNPTYASVMYI